MIVRLAGRRLGGAYGIMVAALFGIVATTVAVEHSSVPWSDWVDILSLHSALAFVWMGPLVSGLGTLYALQRMQERGELRAMAVLGLSERSLLLPAGLAAVTLAVVGAVVHSFVVPGLASAPATPWIWTEAGLWHGPSGRVVALPDLHVGQDGMPSVLDFQRAEPRLASWAALRWTGSQTEKLEVISRCARMGACLGFSLVAARAVRWSHAWAKIALMGVVLVGLDLVGWEMGAHAQMSIWTGGTLGLWIWLVWLVPQPSIRRSLPE